MDVLFVAAEVAPFSKTGGLGDVAGALPQALAARGHRVLVFTPRHGVVDPVAHRLEPLPFSLQAGAEAGGLWVARGPAPVFFLEHERYFGHRQGIYSEPGHEYGDNAERFAFFCRAALALPRLVGFRPRILHLHDWHAALAAWLLRHEVPEGGAEPWVGEARSVLTIHNLAHQGVFPKEAVPALGLPWSVFRYDGMEFHDRLNFLKGGLTFADVLTTVSPTYAREILTPEQGEGLDPLLRHRAGELHGILNGIDAVAWDPARDPHLPAHFSPGHLAGKARCKAALQRELGLPVRPGVPLAVLVGRLADQKGIDIALAALPELLAQDVQVAVLGTGRPDYERALERLDRERPERFRVRTRFDEGLAHRMEAGADLFLMPSRFEPCGLNQMYSLRYGTVPVVRAVGGLADTVEDFDGKSRGTGFVFQEYSPGALLTAVRRALDVYRDKAAWSGLVGRGMAQDNSWEQRAERYEALYRRIAGS
ncbi:MAG TPA: glycogen synthase GlgA [Anaeromyxobacteraceae bacterium]|nr:glycogen synthase GlgA [Anaeromyxobacteraceae bacterium]